MQTIDIKVAVQRSLSAIGKEGDTAPPESTKNTFPQAYEFFIASQLRSAAIKRYDAAKEAAMKSGVLGTETDYIEGSTITTWKNGLFDIAAKKASSSSTLDRTMLANTLTRKGWKPDQIEALIEDSSKPRKGAVTYEVVLKS